MLSPQVSRHLKQLLAFYQRGYYVEQEFRDHLVSLVSRENPVDMFDALPTEIRPWLKEAVVAATQVSLDEDCLSPEESVFQESTAIAAYYLRVAEVLLERSASRPRPGLTVVCLPSFEVEWALRIRGSTKIGFTGLLTVPEEKIWCHVDPGSIRVQAKQRSLGTMLGEELCEIWKKVLLRTRHPMQVRVGCDGISYHFACWGDGVGYMSGRTWSPDRATIPGKLVAISHALRAYIEAGDEVSEQARIELEKCIEEFSQRKASEPE